MSLLESDSLSRGDDVPDGHSHSVATIRSWIVSELARALRVDASSIDTAGPLYSLGASSLIAISMTGDLAQWLNRDLPATLMWDHPSIDAIAESLGGSSGTCSTPQGIVGLQPHGDRTPLFCFPGAGGHSTTFAPMVSFLDTEQPSYGLVVPGINGEREPFERVEDIAGAMIESVRRIQSHGPYQFAGYSFGGLLAYEAAQQMCAAGETVSLLAIYDTFTPKCQVLRPRLQRLVLHGYFLTVRNGRRQYIRDQLKRRRDERELLAALHRQAESDAEKSNKLALQVEHVNYRATRRYEPRPYSGVITLFRPARRSAAAVFYKMEQISNGWNALAPGRVRVIDLPGDHHTLLDKENAGSAAEMLRPYLVSR